ncbi:SusC/RagA family TonB-linked outer membrane protein [Sphingobacterium alkalisoli]|nr:SusC/RagA family TonB-linked outer membrane protein [Sphingobacterium alkalisoli]
MLLGLLLTTASYGQTAVKGKVTDVQGSGIAGASIRSHKSVKFFTSANDGSFSIEINFADDTLEFAAVGYLPQKVEVGTIDLSDLTVSLELDTRLIDEVEVVNTGYYSLPKERLTGSFEHIGEKELQRSASPTILGRLEGMVNGLQFDRSGQSRENVNGFSFRIRGLSTIESDRVPLIVWDGFPFEGRLEDINPENVQSVTVLKDAAASSIWGARAGNGVIVITSKSGAREQVALNYVGNTTVMNVPDLFYNPNRLEAPVVMDMQKSMFLKGRYQEQDQIQLPEYVELLIQHRDGLIDETEFARQQELLKGRDFRREATEHLYRKQVGQQHNVTISGGGKMSKFFLSGFYQDEAATVVGNDSRNLGFTANNQFNLFKGNEVSVNINYTSQRARENGLTFNELSNAVGGADIYSTLVLENSDFATVPRYGVRQTVIENAEALGLMDWSYSPLMDRALLDNQSNRNALLLQFGVKQQLLPNWSIQLRYQYGNNRAESQDVYDVDSYYVRDFRNRYMDPVTKQSPIPNGSIFQMDPVQKTTQGRVRLQSDFNKDFQWDGGLNLLVGAELSRSEQWMEPGSIVYNYDKELWTGNASLDFSKLYALWGGGMARIPSPVVSRRASSGRDVSYYGNMSYTHHKKYVVSGSLRWDGSNLFGVKANQKGTPLWSIGAAWTVSDERFFPKLDNGYLKIRATYGVAGNMDRSQSSYPTISYIVNSITNRTSASLGHPGNPLLRWEQVRMVNLGMDWQTGRLSGSIEPYWKKSSDLLGNVLMDPTTGTAIFSNYKMNYADMGTRGVDIKLAADVLKGSVDWTVSVLYSHVTNRVDNFVDNTIVNSDYYLATGRIPREGSSLDALYALPWHGLSPENGLPIIFVEGEPSSDYTSFYQGFDPLALLDAGVTVAPNFLHLQNQLQFKGFSLGGIIGMRWGHVFRRSSMYPGAELAYPGAEYHRDYTRRWQAPGDEQHTIVPASVEALNVNLLNTFKYSSALVEKADVIRLQQINVSYDVPTSWSSKAGVKRLSAFANLNNVGILWRANNERIDPDFPNADYPAPFQFTLGLRLQL